MTAVATQPVFASGRMFDGKIQKPQTALRKIGIFLREFCGRPTFAQLTVREIAAARPHFPLFQRLKH